MVARACCSQRDISSGFTEKGNKNESVNCEITKRAFSKSCCHALSFPNSFFSTRNLSSGAGTKSDNAEGGEEEEGFSDLDLHPETIESADKIIEDSGDLNIEGDVSEEEIDETVASELGLSDDESESNGDKKETRKSNTSPLFELLIETPRQSTAAALNKWVNEGKPLGRTEISLAVLNLRKIRHYAKALQLYEWMEANKHLEFNIRDYVSYFDLIVKVQGILKAEQHINKIPESFRTEPIYRTILANCAATGNIKKAEEIFEKIKGLDSPLTTFSCNQLLLLYKKADRRKVAGVLKVMEEKNVKPSSLTYRLLIDMKGRSHDICGMENLVDMMKSEGIEPDIGTKSVLARHYIHAGQMEKAESILKEIECEDVNEHRDAFKELLTLYAALGKKNDVERIWKFCESNNPRASEGLACINAWGKLGKVENAEKVFESMGKTRNKLSPRYYNDMIKLYANHKLLAKGKKMAEEMAEEWRIGPSTWDALVKLYVECGEVEKADSLLQKAVERKQLKPLYSSYMLVLEHYARRGDIHNAEKIFQNIRQNGYTGRMGMYYTLLKAYQTARTPVYGFRERLKADNMYPNNAVAAQLAALDTLKKTQISDLLA